MTPAELELTIPSSERPKTHASDRVSTTIGCVNLCIAASQRFNQFRQWFKTM